MINQYLPGTPTSRRSPAVAIPNTVTIKAGDPVLLGLIPAVAMDTPANTAGNQITFETGGSFYLTVIAKSSLSPSTGLAIGGGEDIYADGGTTVAVAGLGNITFGFTLDANSSSTAGGLGVAVKFGQLDPTGPSIASAATNAAAGVALLRGM